MRDELEKAATDLAAAPFEAERWTSALDGLALAGGGWAAQLLVGSPSGYLMDLTPRMPADGVAEAQSFGLDPAHQPRARILDAPLMHVLGDDDLATEREQSHSGFYAFMRRHDVPYACMSHVDQIGEAAVVITALRSASAGHVQAADRERFSALLPHLRAAARLQLRLEDQGANLAMNILGASGQSALVCDGRGRLIAATPSAEAALAAGIHLTLRQSRLAAVDPACDAMLSRAVDRAASPMELERPSAGRVRLLNGARTDAVTAEVTPIPPDIAAFRVQAAVLVLLGTGRPNTGLAVEDSATKMKEMYGLTAAEVQVARALAAGDTVRGIADRRTVAISTVRSQLAGLFAKTGTRRQAELVALLLRDLG